VFVIAEAGVNHDGDVGRAHALVDAAVAAGADAIKFQTFVPDALAARQAPIANYQRERVTSDGDQLQMLRRMCLSPADLKSVAACCRHSGIIFLSTPFDLPSATLLESLGVPAFKVASGELTNLAFLRALAERGRPLVISTGMGTLDEIRTAVRVVQGVDTQLILLHCVSSYPAPLEQANLRAIDTLRSTFDVPVGYSDHCLGPDASLAAVARDACVIERHLTLDRTQPGPDHAMSLEPGELHELIHRIRTTEAMLGNGSKIAQPAELDTRTIARRSIVAVRALNAGEILTAEALAVKRPGNGLAPACLPEVLGSRLAQALAVDEQLTHAHLEPRA
jgi:N,N'-diacetyllegionaminate synthase